MNDDGENEEKGKGNEGEEKKTVNQPWEVSSWNTEETLQNLKL